MAKKISSSVGKGGKNKPEDVTIVQELLNDFTKLGGYKKLDVDGLIGPKTISAIAAFQKEVVGSKVDSRVDPSSDTFDALSKGARKVEAENKKAEKEDQKQKDAEAKKAKEEESAEGGDGKPQVKGDYRGLDKKLLGLLEAVSAHYNKPIVIETGKVSASSGGGLGNGEDLWNEWVDQNRGKKNSTLRKNESLRRQLDGLYESMKREEFVRLASNGSSGPSGADVAHAAGKAFDLKRNTDSKVVAALATVLRKENEGELIHFDDTGCNVPSTISDSLKKKWK